MKGRNKDMMRTVFELTREEMDELKTYMLFNDEEEFYEDIDEISDSDVYARFSDHRFSYGDFICNSCSVMAAA